MPERVIVFIDHQNTYMGARDAFFRPGLARHVDGQFDPTVLANHIASSGPQGSRRVLQEVRVYAGRPNPEKDARSSAAHMKQCSQWDRQGVVVIPRMLRYPPSWPRQRAQEKGIDVKLAIDFVTMAVNDDYDVGVMVSGDTDLVPALEYVANLNPSKIVEVAAWASPGMRRRLSINSKSLWCHWLDRTVYDAVADATNYAKRGAI